MRQQLLTEGGEDEDTSSLQAAGRRSLRNMRLRGGAGEDEAMVMCAGGVCVFSVFLISLMISTLEPNEYGLMKNSISGSISEDVVRGGMHLTGPFKSFVKFPAVQMTMEFSRRSSDRGPIQTRTGADPSDPDSGGQPISISCAIQYKMVQDEIRHVYMSFGSFQAARQRFLLLAGNMISNTAQEFTPQDFWMDRHAIAARIFQQVNKTLVDQGYVVAMGIQLMKVDFATKFEDSITGVQVAEQQQEINKYDQQVQQVSQSIEVLKSQNNAKIANISAGADADSKEIMARAKRDAFNLKQGTKATKYAQLQAALQLDSRQMSEYFKIKALQSQEASGKVVVGLPGILDAAVSPH